MYNCNSGDAMKKDNTMRKTSFLTGAFITTAGIFLSKILGALYVIPFHAIIGEKGGALYGYAYTVYNGFLSLSTAGIPLAISKVVSEYRSLGYVGAKNRTFVLGKRLAQILGLTGFLFLFFFAPFLAKGILGDVVGGNTIQDVTFVIRVIGTAILVVPVLGIYRGFFEGHRLFGPSSISQVLEQLIRVLIIICGSFLFLRVFHLSISICVGIALLGATIGALFSYVYLFVKKYKNKKIFNLVYRKVGEPIIANEVIMKKIVCYAIPFVLIDIFKSCYGFTDMFTLVKSLVKNTPISSIEAETIYSIFSTWAQKFNMMILAVSSGVIVSLIPNLTESLVKGEKRRIQEKIVQGLSVLLFLTIPLTFCVSFLAKPIWNLFYGNSVYGPNILCYYIFVGLFAGAFSYCAFVLQSLKDFKLVVISLMVGIMTKVLLNSRLLIAFYKMRLPAYYGAITATILGYFISFLICLFILKKKYSISLENFIKNIIDIICSSVFMIICLLVFNLFVPCFSKTRLCNLWLIFLYTIIGISVYLCCSKQSGVLMRVFGEKYFYNLKEKFFLYKKKKN